MGCFGYSLLEPSIPDEPSLCADPDQTRKGLDYARITFFAQHILVVVVVVDTRHLSFAPVTVEPAPLRPYRPSPHHITCFIMGSQSCIALQNLNPGGRGIAPPPTGVVPNFDNPESHFEELLAVNVVCISLAGAFVAMRLYTKYCFAARKLSADDGMSSLRGW